MPARLSPLERARCPRADLPCAPGSVRRGLQRVPPPRAQPPASPVSTSTPDARFHIRSESDSQRSWPAANIDQPFGPWAPGDARPPEKSWRDTARGIGRKKERWNRSGPRAVHRNSSRAGARASVVILGWGLSLILKIAHIDTGKDFRGGQDLLLSLARGLKQRGHRQMIVCPPGSPLAQRAASEELEVMPLGTSRHVTRASARRAIRYRARARWQGANHFLPRFPWPASPARSQPAGRVHAAPSVDPSLEIQPHVPWSDRAVTIGAPGADRGGCAGLAHRSHPAGDRNAQRTPWSGRCAPRRARDGVSRATISSSGTPPRSLTKRDRTWLLKRRCCWRPGFLARACCWRAMGRDDRSPRWSSWRAGHPASRSCRASLTI